MYLEKIYFNKVYRDNPKEMERLGFYRGNSDDVTANQKVRFKVKAVGLDYTHVARWLYAEEQKTSIRTFLNCLDNKDSVGKEQVQQAQAFVDEFRKRLDDAGTDKLLIRLINEHL